CGSSLKPLIPPPPHACPSCSPMSPLTWLTFLPLAGALLLLLVPSSRVGLLRAVGLGASLGTAAIAVWIWCGYEGRDADPAFLVDAPWFALPGGGPTIRFRL